MDVTLTEPNTKITRRRVQSILDPMEAWRAFKPNSLIWARWWLENGGGLPTSCHHVIADRLAPWIAAVIAGGPEMLDALLAVVPPFPPNEPAPTRSWIMPAVGKAYSTELDLAPEPTPQVPESYRERRRSICCPPSKTGNFFHA